MRFAYRSFPSGFPGLAWPFFRIALFVLTRLRSLDRQDFPNGPDGLGGTSVQVPNPFGPSPVDDRQNQSLAGFGCLRIAGGMPIIILLAVSHRKKSAKVNRMDVGAASFSQISCAPIKLAEYLGCGIPANFKASIRDAAEIVRREKVGVGFPNFSTTSMVCTSITCLRRPTMPIWRYAAGPRHQPVCSIGRLRPMMLLVTTGKYW